MKELFEQIAEFNKKLSQPLTESGQLIQKTCERFAKQQMSFISEMVNSGIKPLQSLGGTKKVEDVIGIQTNSVAEATAQCVKFAQQNLDSLIQTSNEFNKLFEKNFATISEQQAKVKVSTKAD